jgi:hypothetical protein
MLLVSNEVHDSIEQSSSEKTTGRCAAQEIPCSCVESASSSHRAKGSSVLSQISPVYLGTVNVISTAITIEL